MWPIAALWVIAWIFGSGYALLKLIGDPQVSGVLGVVVGLFCGVLSMILAADALVWIERRLFPQERAE